uniref:ABC transporter domain-containing protein n=1 Tax=Steinernema glaseri TaxID=37863 RepID=A0A1I8ACG4_9BILA
MPPSFQTARLQPLHRGKHQASLEVRMTNTSSLTLDSVTYALPDGRLLFSNLTERFDQRRTGLVGRNGVGKSILARLMA